MPLDQEFWGEWQTCPIRMSILGRMLLMVNGVHRRDAWHRLQGKWGSNLLNCGALLHCLIAIKDQFPEMHKLTSFSSFLTAPSPSGGLSSLCASRASKKVLSTLIKTLFWLCGRHLWGHNHVGPLLKCYLPGYLGMPVPLNPVEQKIQLKSVDCNKLQCQRFQF